MSGLRVLHITPAFFGEGGVFGGAERYSLELARAMAAVTPTSLVTFGPQPRQFRTPEGLSVSILGPAWAVRGQQLNPIHHGIIRAIAQADVVHCHQPALMVNNVAVLLSRLTGRRVFASDLGGGGWHIGGYFKSYPKWFHGHLHISQYSRTLAGQANDPTSHVIYGGIDTDRFAPNPAIPQEPLVVFVGRLMPHKGVNDLVAALPEGLTLELIGKPYHEQFFADLQKQAIGKKVVFRTNCHDDDIVRAYQRATCVVLPSVYRTCYGVETRVPELLGQTALEGLSCGSPAIVTDVASLPEVVRDQVTGFVVPPNNPAALRTKLEWLRDHRQEAAQMGRAGREFILNQFTWPQVVRECMSAYIQQRVK